MPNKKTAAQRQPYVDAMKGFGILCVVIGHFIEYHRGTAPGINALFTYGVFPGMHWDFLAERFATMDANKQTGMWALIIALVLSCATLVLLGLGRWANLQQTINKGVLGSMLPIFNTASEVGYGAVIASLAGFAGATADAFTWSAAKQAYDRTKARTRLLELFELFDAAEPFVVAARRKLAAALY